MINFDDLIKVPQIPNHQCRILITGGSGSSKTNSLFNLISQQPDIDKNYLYAKDPYNAKRENIGSKYLNDSKAFIELSNNMGNTCKNIGEYNPNKKRKILIIFDDMIADMLSNKKLNSIVTECFIRSRKLNIFLVFITQSYFKVPKEVRLNNIHFFYSENFKQIRTSPNCI